MTRNDQPRPVGGATSREESATPRPQRHRHHDHGHDHEHHHHPEGRRPRWLVRLAETLPFLHAHDGPGADDALRASERGIRAVQVSLLGLGVTALFQLAIALLSGSVALLADTLHNVADALTAVPLWIALALGRRSPSRRYTYGLGRAEDLAGLFVVVVIALSAALAGWESVERLRNPRTPTHLEWVALAALAGFLGNEMVALFRIREGRAIGSAALVADGYHARADGLTSLGVLLGALGVWLGFPLADPLVGLGITAIILFVLRDATRQVWGRLMDAVEPDLVDAVEATARAVSGVQDAHDVRVRWVGHRLHAELHITVDEDLPTRESHRLAEEVRHALFHALPHLATITVHVDPCGHGGEDPHHLTGHHARPPADAGPSGGG
ncbi:MAG TPA: cation diffusion facilitator family transporter [Chloroflexota bacterium]